jgi:class 3 adenylate cyclase/putative methionine-R-sulfoxide reductase with GAF domain
MTADKDQLLEVIDHHRNVVNIIHDVSSKVNASHDLNTIFNTTFTLLDQYFEFKYIMILLVDKENPDQLKVKASHGYNGMGIGATVPIGKGVIGIVAKNRKLLRMGNVIKNVQYFETVNTCENKKFELPGIEHCASQIAVPLLNHEDLEGVISIESNKPGLFAKRDEELLELIGVQIGIAINNARQFNIIENTNAQLKDLNENLEGLVLERTKELADKKDKIEDQHKLLAEQHGALEEEQSNTQKMLEKIETLFGQQVSREVANELVSNNDEVQSKAYDVTVMFLDIRDFTLYADSRDPEEVASFQNIVFSELIKIVRRHKGITNQILGDGIMAVFGAPVTSKTHSSRAVAAGYDILAKVSELAEVRKIPPIRLGIGLHSGRVIAGNIGNAFRKQYSLTGSTVIIASRIEQLNKKYCSQFLVSETVYQEIQHEAYDIKPLGKTELKGIERPINIYQLA